MTPENIGIQWKLYEWATVLPFPFQFFWHNWLFLSLQLSLREHNKCTWPFSCVVPFHFVVLQRFTVRIGYDCALGVGKGMQSKCFYKLNSFIVARVHPAYLGTCSISTSSRRPPWRDTETNLGTFWKQTNTWGTCQQHYKWRKFNNKLVTAGVSFVSQTR